MTTFDLPGDATAPRAVGPGAGAPRQALTRYDALRDSVLSRSRAERPLKGLDKMVGALRLRIASRGSSIAPLLREAAQIDALAPTLRGLADRALDDRARELRALFVRRRFTDLDQRAALAVTREIARRETGEEAYPVQLAGAMGLLRGRIIEMATGEGKTLTASIAAPLLAWTHRHVHVFTVNDYLASRDAESRAPIYKRCGVTVGAIESQTPPDQRASIYAKGVIYGSPKQITADYLRDQLRVAPLGSPWSGRQTLMRMGPTGMESLGPIVPGLRAALVDEADAVLIDEGVVPLIIARSRREDDMASAYLAASQIARKLDEGPDYTVDLLRKKAELKRRGLERARAMWSKVPDPIFRAERRAGELVRQALVAEHCYKRGAQYEIVDGQVIIVDEYTGRFLHDRTWEHGLHQAVEAKEGLEVTADRETLARLSFQRFFRSYPFLCGMTGTVADSKKEMETVYRRAVVSIPTNRPVVRERRPMRLFARAEAKWNAITDEIERLSGEGRPVLVGTRSIEASQKLSERLDKRGVAHRVLNALNDAEEGELIALAGNSAAVTVATNMAGRGTDIKLDPKARAAGGLAVILTEMHGAKRIDRQFAGRAGRQGDPGSEQIFVSLEDEIIDRQTGQLRRLVRPTGANAGFFGRQLFRQAQRRSEARDRRNRASVLRQDDWIDKHLPGW